MINSEFGKNVKRYREALEMTQEELAIKSGYKSRRRHFRGNGYNRLFPLFYSQKSKVPIQRIFNHI